MQKIALSVDSKLPCRISSEDGALQSAVEQNPWELLLGAGWPKKPSISLLTTAGEQYTALELPLLATVEAVFHLSTSVRPAQWCTRSSNRLFSDSVKSLRDKYSETDLTLNRAPLSWTNTALKLAQVVSPHTAL